MMDATEFPAACDRSNIRPLARMITLGENDPQAAYRVLGESPERSDRSNLLGVTGPPGVGKSSLVNTLICELRSGDQSVAVLAIDPSSPYSGGALLGDRIRMNAHSNDPGVYIRSMATRGVLGGLSSAAWLAVRILETWGFDWIIIETAGVGQSEIDIVDLADTTLLIVSPALGDDVQVMKAGVMEVADLFVINKVDMPGADRVHNALAAILSREDRSPIILETIATASRQESGIPALMRSLTSRVESISRSGERDTLRLRRYRIEVRRAALALLGARVDRAVDGQIAEAGNPFADARRVLEKLVTDEVRRSIDADTN